MRRFQPLFWCSVLLGACAALIAACAEHKGLAAAAFVVLVALFVGVWLATECRFLLTVLQRARRIRQIRAARAPAAICTDDIH